MTRVFRASNVPFMVLSILVLSESAEANVNIAITYGPGINQWAAGPVTGTGYPLLINITNNSPGLPPPNQNNGRRFYVKLDGCAVTAGVPTLKYAMDGAGVLNCIANAGGVGTISLTQRELGCFYDGRIRVQFCDPANPEAGGGDEGNFAIPHAALMTIGVPALSQAGLGLVVVLVAVGGGWLFRRYRAVLS